MIDYGNEDSRYAALIPNQSFSELRRSDPQQHRYLLGDRFEGISVGAVRIGAQVTPPRLHALADGAERLCIESEDFCASPSLARGGLGAAWSAGVFPFSDDELRAMSLGLDELRPHYDAVAERIGVCGDHDDLEAFFVASPSMMPALDIDSNAEAILTRYRCKRVALNANGFFLAPTRLAVCTRRHRGRGPHRYLDMAYWADVDRSIYRPQWTLGELERSSHFTYLGRRLVDSFTEESRGVRVRTAHADTGKEESHEAAALVLAAGTLGTARIVLRSLGRYDTPVPILCNPYAYVPMLNLGTFGRATRDRRHSLGQLTVMVRIPGAASRIIQAQVFSYRSLLTFKVMKESPLAYRESLRIVRALMPYLSVLGIHHEDRPSDEKFCALRRGEGNGPDRLQIDYRASEEETRLQEADEAVVRRFFRRLGCLPLKKLRPGHGANMHYAGTFPIQSHGQELTCALDGRLRGTRAVFLADGSVFPWLPPKGLTFTLMANANRVGTLLAKRPR
jgi:hypothetical protein